MRKEGGLRPPSYSILIGFYLSWNVVFISAKHPLFFVFNDLELIHLSFKIVCQIL